MSGYSFVRVVRLMTKHYVDHSRRYAMFCGMMIFVPVLFAILSSDIDSTVDMGTLMFIVGAFAIAPVTMNELRSTGTKILVNTLPVSTAERMTFIILNTSVIYSLLAALCGVAGMAISATLPFIEGDVREGFAGLWSDIYGEWALHGFIWIISSGSVLINAFARKRLIESYLITFFVLLLATWTLTKVVIHADLHIEWHDSFEWIIRTIYCLIPVVLYAAAGVVLRRRQIKW